MFQFKGNIIIFNYLDILKEVIQEIKLKFQNDEVLLLMNIAKYN